MKVLPGQRRPVEPHRYCCEECRRATEERDEVRALAHKWAADEQTYPENIATARLSKLILRICGNELRTRLDMALTGTER